MLLWSIHNKCCCDLFKITCCCCDLFKIYSRYTMLLWSIQDLFKIHKKTSNCVVTCYHKFFYCVTPMSHSKTGRNYVSTVQCRMKIMLMPREVPVEQSISSTTSEELKSNDTIWVVASWTGTPDMGSSLLRTTESIYIVSLLFRTLIFLPVFEWDIGITL